MGLMCKTAVSRRMVWAGAGAIRSNQSALQTQAAQVVLCQQSRRLSTVPPPTEGDSANTNKGALQQFDYDDYDDYEEPTTAGGHVAMWTRTILQIGFLGLVAGCFTLAAIELFPGPTSPQAMYSRAFDVVRTNAEVQKITGDDMSAYGRRVGSRQIDSHKYTHEDGTTRTRIRFNVMGKRGRAMVWAEMSSRMGELTEEFAYLVVQDRRTGKVITVHDNRTVLDQLPPGEEPGAIGKLIAGILPK